MQVPDGSILLEANLIEPNLLLLLVCLVAFTAVFFLLSILAAAMVGITALLPLRKPVTDSTVVAAIASTVASLIPGARVTNIEEVR